MVDIRERDRVQLQPSKPASAPQSIIEAPSIEGVTKPIKSYLKQQESYLTKVKEDTKRLRLADADNQMEAVNLRAKALIADAEGENVYKAYDEANRLINTEYQKIQKGLPPEWHPDLNTRANKKKLEVEGLYLNHAYKEQDKLRDQTYKTAANYATEGLTQAYRSPVMFEQKLKDIERLGYEHGSMRGLSKGIIDANVQLTKSKGILSTIEAAGAIGDYDGAKMVYDNYKSMLVSDDVIKAEAALKKGQDNQKSTIAKAAVDRALTLFPDDAGGARMMLGEIKDGDVYKEAIAMFNNEFNFRKQLKQQQDEKQMGDALEAVRKNGGRVTEDILSIVPKDKREKILDFGVKLQEGKLTATNWETYARLDKMSFSNEQAFVATDLRAYANELNYAQMNELMQRKERIQNKERSRIDSIKYSSSQKVNFLINNKLMARGIDPLLDAEKYNAYKSLGYTIYDEVIESMPNEQDIKKIETEFERRFSAATLPKVTAPRGGLISELWRAITGGERPMEEITPVEAENRIREGEPIADISNADQKDLERIRQRFFDRKNRYPTDEELQKLYDNAILKRLKVR